jgi:hypothetical protein
MSKKFEQLLDYLVNEEMDKANELFHEIVVEKSREIYENMIAEEAEEESVEEADGDDEQEESVEEADEDQDESVEEGFGMDDEGDETSMSIGGDNDPADSEVDAITDPSAPGHEEGGSEGGVSAGEEQILDVLQQLKAEFDAIVNGGDGAHDEPAEPAEPSFGGDDDGEDEPEDDEEDDEGEDESMGTPMREYVERVGMDWDKNAMKGPKGQNVGAESGDNDRQGETNPRSVVSSGKGKPSTGATAENILSGKGTDTSSNTGTSPNADKGSRGLVGATKGKFTTGSIHNVDGVKSGIKTVSKQGAGYPGNNKTPGPVGSGSGDKAGQTGDTGGKKQFLPQFGKK